MGSQSCVGGGARELADRITRWGARMGRAGEELGLMYWMFKWRWWASDDSVGGQDFVGSGQGKRRVQHGMKFPTGSLRLHAARFSCIFAELQKNCSPCNHIIIFVINYIFTHMLIYL